MSELMIDKFARSTARGAGRWRERLKRVKIIYEVADTAKGTEEYRFSAERRTCFDASARGGSTWYREARDSRRYRSPWPVSGTRVRAESRAHVD